MGAPKLVILPLTYISAACPHSPRKFFGSPFSENEIPFPDLPIRFSASNPNNIRASATVSFFELNSLIFFPFTETVIKSLPLFICAVTAMPIGVIDSGPNSFLSLNLISLMILLPLTTTLSSASPISSAISPASPGIRLPPPTKKTALGALLLYSSIA